MKFLLRMVGYGKPTGQILYIECPLSKTKDSREEEKLSLLLGKKKRIHGIREKQKRVERMFGQRGIGSG